MENKTSFGKRILSIMCLLFLYVSLSWSGDKPFVVVIDAGHGGKDPGALGYTLKLKEKDINLKMALKLGDLLSKEKGVKVLYTRKKDVFIPLDDRAQVANKAKADLFISIHVNAAENRSARGTESYAVGSSSANLEVAKRENAVMLYESDYKTKYRGFDPNSTESYIMFDFLQSKYMEQSISFASRIEKGFTGIGRSSRGVKQAGFWVLKQAAMPAVLVELGYISNRDEEAFLSKDKNLDVMAQSISKAFVQYKKNHDNRNSSGYKDADSNVSEVHAPTNQSEDTKPKASDETQGAEKKLAPNTEKMTDSIPLVRDSMNSAETAPKEAQRVSETPDARPSSEKPSVQEEPKKSQVYFAVQFCTSTTRKPLNCKDFKGCVPAQEFEESGKFKYVYGQAPSFEAGVKLRDEVRKTFKDAFLVVVKDGKKLSTEEAKQYYK